MVSATGSNNQINLKNNDLDHATPNQLGGLDKTRLSDIGYSTLEEATGSSRFEEFEDNVFDNSRSRLPLNQPTSIINGINTTNQTAQKTNLDKLTRAMYSIVGDIKPCALNPIDRLGLAILGAISHQVDKKRLPKTIEKNKNVQNLLSRMRQLGITDAKSCTDDQAKKLGFESAKKLERQLPRFNSQGKAITDIDQLSRKVQLAGLKNQARLDYVKQNRPNWKALLGFQQEKNSDQTPTPNQNLPTIL